jgi:YesN/AraC family two-component response regulator
MLKHIRENYTERLTLGSLAQTIGRQSAYLGRVFREQIGLTVHEYVTRVRLRDAAAQIGSGIKVEGVALSLGYRSKKNFYRQFKRHFGCTPAVYRHRRQDNRESGGSMSERLIFAVELGLDRHPAGCRPTHGEE